MRIILFVSCAVCAMLLSGCLGIERVYNKKQMERVGSVVADIQEANDPSIPEGAVLAKDNLRLATELSVALDISKEDYLVPRVTKKEWAEDSRAARTKSEKASEKEMPIGVIASWIGGAVVVGTLALNILSRVPGPIGELTLIAKQLLGGINPKELKLNNAMQAAMQRYKKADPDNYTENPFIKELSRVMGQDLKDYVIAKHGRQPNKEEANAKLNS